MRNLGAKTLVLQKELDFDEFLENIYDWPWHKIRAPKPKSFFPPVRTGRDRFFPPLSLFPRRRANGEASFGH